MQCIWVGTLCIITILSNKNKVNDRITFISLTFIILNNNDNFTHRYVIINYIISIYIIYIVNYRILLFDEIIVYLQIKKKSKFFYIILL